MREFISKASVQGLYHGKRIRSISYPWKITVRHNYHCVCDWICETFQITDARDVESCVFYNGVQQFEWNHMTLIAVGYQICMRYIDSESRKKTITNQGNAIFFNPSNDCKYLLHIPNPPACKILKNKVILGFPIIVAFRNT